MVTVQHLMLLLAAPFLIVLARPLVVLMWALPSPARRRVVRTWRQVRWTQVGWRVLTVPPIVWLLHTGLLWIWHMPLLYEAALQSNQLPTA